MSKSENHETGSNTDESAPPRGVVGDDRTGDVDRGTGGGDGLTDSSPMPTTHKTGRRTFIKGLGAAAAVAVGVGHPSGFVQESRAAAPLVAGVIGAAIVTDWALREFDVLGSNAPPEGLTPNALHQSVYESARVRESNNASTFVDNQTIIGQSEQPAFTEAKVAAIEGINNNLSKANTITAGQDAANAYYTTVQRNLLKSWNESVREFYTLRSALKSHPDMNETTVFGSDIRHRDQNAGFNKFLDGSTREISLFDGSSFTIEVLRIETEYNSSTGNDYQYTHEADATDRMVDGYTQADTMNVVASPLDSDLNDPVAYLSPDEWVDIVNDLETARTNVTSGIETWVNNVYGQIEAGQINAGELLTPSDRAQLMATEEPQSVALSDLIALNVPVDLQNEATIRFPSTGTTMRGSFALTDESDGPLESGTSYDPSTFSGEVYFTTDTSLLEGTFEGFTESISADGNITFTEQPYGGTILSATTSKDETIRFPAENVTYNNNGYQYNATGELEDTNALVESMSYFSTDSQTNYQTLRLSAPFEIQSFTNRVTGESADSATFEKTTPQDDTNYITQEEWDAMEEKNQELIDKYEEATEESNGGLFGGIPWGNLGGSGGIGVLAVGGAVALGVIAVLREAIKFYLPGR